MPNWCSNSLTITGHKYDIETILERLRKGDADKMFETLIGINPEISVEQYEKNWYDENISRFGTKWDVSYTMDMFQYSEDTIYITFETAWSPPVEFCRSLSKMYNVKCVLFYSEPGIGFAGQFEVDGDGNESDDECGYLEGLYKYDNEYFWDEVESWMENYTCEETPVEEFLSLFVGIVTDEELTSIKIEYEEMLNEAKSTQQ